ncbi:MAG: nitric oxide reductase activation protein NorD [Nitrospirota bacterium]
MTERHIVHLREGLVRNLTLDFFEDEEIQAVVHGIDVLDDRLRQKALALCLALSHASSSLVPNVLKHIRKAASFLPLDEMERWMAHAFDLLDAQGVDPFLAFVSRTDEDALRAFQSPGGLRFQKIAGVLEPFLRGVSGRELKIAPDKNSFTDTSTIYLPSMIDRFEEPGHNFLLYKLTAVHKWAQIVCGTLTPDEELLRTHMPENGRPDIESFFRRFPEKNLAIDLYTILEALRLERFLGNELPGLMRAAEPIKAALFEGREPLSNLPQKTAFVEGLYRYYLKKTVPEQLKGGEDALQRLKQAHTPSESLRLLADFYRIAERLDGDYKSLDMPILGTIKPERVSFRLRAEREARKKRLEGIIRRLLTMPELEPPRRTPSEEAHCERAPQPERDYLLIKGRMIELDSELRELIEELGDIHGGILVKGSDIGAARHCISLKEELFEEEEGGEVTAPGKGIKYDEWDYRRGGYKRSWCTLYEHDIHPGSEPFVEMALKRYSGYIKILRKKFELLKREPRVLRLQKDGEDVDIDAAVEAYADMHAGFSPGENLFTRLDRQERNMAVLFLLDMSGSTKGWVNEAEKESLVMMCEALETLGDRYAIYGFSGMTRTRCDFYKIKSFDEGYSEAVKKRIAGIAPKDYTRMGPPLRHSITKLKSVEARTKIMITLSDGKPEDWDAYKGEYGIEDTRRALIEAKEKGIHSFCITIDKEAHSYLPYMYGEANYTFIDDVRKLPNKITDIYRKLTT